MMLTAPKPSRSRNRYYGNPLGLFLFLLPGVGLYTLIVLVPILESFVFSIFTWEGMRPLWQFNDFQYYALMLQDSIVWNALLNNFRAWVLYAVIQVPLALVLAFVLTRKVRGVDFFRLLYYIPQITSVLLLALIFRFLLTSDYGLNALLSAVGLENLIQPWMSKDGLAQWVMNVPQTWAGVGFWMVIFIAAIGGISEDLYNAAELDGANDWQLLRYVTIPSIRGVLVFSYIMTGIWALQAYLYQFIMPATPGAPMNMTHTLGSYITYFVLNMGRSDTNWGYASALAVFLFVLSAFASAIVWRAARWSQASSGE